MRRFCHLLSLVLLACSFAAIARAEQLAMDVHPQRAVVTSPGAAVRSGPGDSFYLTDTLPEETVVEVYRTEPDGWCAIRPPSDSFSWVFSQNVRLIDDGLAEVNKDDVAARVGSRLSSQRDVVQVRMKQGEKVAILGRDEREGGLWYKVAPPAGEFRWIAARDIGLGDVADKKSADTGRVTPASHEETIAAPPLAKPDDVGANATNDQWTAAKSPPPATDITPIGSKGPQTATPSSAELANHLQELELRLSRMVAERPATWNIAPLEQAGEQLLARADTVADREAVKATLSKIDRFASIQRRYASMNPAAASAPTSGTPTNDASTAVAAIDPNNPNAGQFDAVGVLRPVVSRRPGAPQFALVNAQGQVVTFVTPAPDVNLQPYIGQRIGVSGSRGYIPEFRRAHVTAGRVSPLNDRMLR